MTIVFDLYPTSNLEFIKLQKTTILTYRLGYWVLYIRGAIE